MCIEIIFVFYHTDNCVYWRYIYLLSHRQLIHSGYMVFIYLYMSTHMHVHKYLYILIHIRTCQNVRPSNKFCFSHSNQASKHMYTRQLTTAWVESAPQGAAAWPAASLVCCNHHFQSLVRDKLYHQDSLETWGQHIFI